MKKIEIEHFLDAAIQLRKVFLKLRRFFKEIRTKYSHKPILVGKGMMLEIWGSI